MEKTTKLRLDIMEDRFGKPLVAALLLCFELESELDALKQEIQSLPKLIPKGWKLVPMEPTDEMINAYIDSPDMTNWKDDFISGYKAMLEAAPKEPS